MRTLVLWDIDHTLISVHGLSHEIYATSFQKVTGQPSNVIADMAGRTDRAIMAETLRRHDIEPTPALMTALAEDIADTFAVRQGEIKTRGQALPGARHALEELALRPDVIQSVLTGNMRSIAVSKLTAFDLHPFIDFEIGAYGLDATDRPPLVPLAQQRASQKYGETFDAATTVLVGDTPHDVDAGHRGGARVVAVATGASDPKALRAAGAELVLPDLSDTSAVVRAVLETSEAQG